VAADRAVGFVLTRQATAGLQRIWYLLPQQREPRILAIHGSYDSYCRPPYGAGGVAGGVVVGGGVPAGRSGGAPLVRGVMNILATGPSKRA
jgi:hypothetical protein